MSFTEQHFCKKCRTCNTLTSTQPEIADENVASCQDSGGGACFGSGDAYSKDEGVDRTIPQQLNQMNLACPPLPQNVSSSGTPNTILSDSSTPRSDASTHYSDIQEKPSLRNDSLLQYLQLEQTTKAQQTLGQCLLDDRSVVGQEKSPISGTTSGTSVSTVDSSSHSSSTDLVPKERRRWVRPPLIGQAASSEVKIISDEFQPSNEEDSLLDDSKVNEFDVIDCSVASSEISGSKHEKLKSSSSNESANNSSVSRSMETGDSTDENFQQTSFQTSVDGEHGIFSDSFVCGKASPSSSVASHKRLEWDSGADVGYQDYQNPTEGGRTSILKLSAIERLALIQNTDKALRMRLDPEGTSGSVPSTGNNPTPTFNTYPVTLHHSIGLPSAESTPTERATCLKTQRKVSAGSIGISPITYVGSAQQGPSRNKPSDEKYKTVEETENISPRGQHVPRTRSASLLNLSTAVTDPSSYLYLYRSQSDPDVSADTGAHTDDSFTLKFTPTKSLKRKGLDSHSLSSGSENTLVHVPTGGSKDVGGRVTVDHTSRHETKEQIGHSKDLEEVLNTFKMPQTFASTSKGYTCSDKDHRHGLHHHYGILCSSCLMIPSELVAQNSSKQVGTLNPPESQSSSANSSHSSTSRSIQSESGDSTHYVKKKDSSQEKGPTQDRATSVSPPVDIMREDISAYVGKTTSFEYLPGRIYESELAAMKSNVPSEQNQDRQLSQLPSSDSSTVGSSQNSIKRQLSHHLKHKAGTTSSGDSEGALWSSPRPTSGTLVRDLERGVSLLRGLVHNNSAQREIVRRVVKRIVSSEYTDDLLERQLCRHNRRPFSGGHTFGTHKLPSLSDKTESEPRARSAPQRSTRRVQSSITLKAPFKKHVETCSQPSDTVSSGANDSSSLRSSGNESQKSITKESTLNQGTIQRVTDNPISEQQPPSLSSNSISKQPPNQPTKQSSDAASEQHANHSTKQSSPNPPSNHSSNQPSNYSSLCPAVATVPPKPLTTDASTATSQEIRTAVSYGTLSSVVSITPMTITVQSSPAPAVPLREVFTSELPVCVGTTKATVNASTMTTPPSSATGPRTAVAQPPPAASSKPVVPDMREVPESREQRRKEKMSSGRSVQQLQLIKCEISHLRNLQKMLKKHPHIVISSPMEHAVPSNHSASRKAKIADGQVSEETLEYQRRSRHQNRAQDDRADRPSASILRKIASHVSSGDSRSTFTSSSILSSSSTSASDIAPDCYACAAGAPETTSREVTEEERGHHRPLRTEPSQKSSHKQREPSPESEDSVTRAVTKAVSSRVKALRNLGQIEEAEVKIRVRMGQPSDVEGPPEKSGSRPDPILDPTPKISISQARPTRHPNLEEEDDFDSKRAELDELIARQRAMDAEARKKLQLLNEMRENVLRRTTLDLKGIKVGQRDACTLTSVDTATNTTPLNSATHVVSRSTQKTGSSIESSLTSCREASPRRSSCPACRVRASSKKSSPDNEPMCRHDPGFTAGQPRGRQRPPMAYFLKVEEEVVPVRPDTLPQRVPSLQVMTVKVPRPVRPPSSIGSSGSMSSGSSSSRHSPAQSPVRSRTVKGQILSCVPTFGHDSRSSPESRRKRSPRKTTRREVITSRSEPQLGRGDADQCIQEYSSDEQTTKGTLQDCLTSNFPEYIQAAERRRQCIFEMSYLRRLRQESRKRLVQLDGDAWVSRQKQARSQKPSTAPAKPAPRTKQSARSMRLASARKYSRAPEVEQKKLEMKKKEENRTNRLLKEIYTSKLREKALRGETTLRSSVSVISSF